MPTAAGGRQGGIAEAPSVLDPTEMTAKDPITTGRGIDWAELSHFLAALVASPRLVGLQLCEYNPEKDPDFACARNLVAVLERSVARRFRV